MNSIVLDDTEGSNQGGGPHLNMDNDGDDDPLKEKDRM